MLLSDPNGCLCGPVRAEAEKNGNPMPADWLCIACRGRQKDKAAGFVCACGVGLMAEEERRLKMCSNCQEDSF